MVFGGTLAVLQATTPDVYSFLFRVGEFGTGPSQFVFPIGLAVGGPLNRIYVSDDPGRPSGHGE